MRARIRTALHVFSEVVRVLATIVCLMVIGWFVGEFLIFISNGPYGV